jgi:lysyl-tRNA synthetase class 2
METTDSVTSGFARVHAMRDMGKIVFADCVLNQEKIQLVIEARMLSGNQDAIKLSRGDLVEIEGTIGATKTNERSVFVSRIKNIIKNQSGLVALPLDNQPLRFSNRHADLALNLPSFSFWKRSSRMLTFMREHLAMNDFMEFNTGVLQEQWDGGLANAFTTNCRANNKPYFLSLTSELKLKRLIAGGFPKVYEIAQSFRNEGMSRDHMPEFSLLEVYGVGSDTDDITKLLEGLVSTVRCHLLSDSPHIADTFPRLEFSALWEQYVGEVALSLDALCRKFPEQFKPKMPEFTWIYKFLNKFVFPAIHEPSFIMHLPKGFSPFAKTWDNDTRFMQGGALAIDGLHIATFSADENDYGTIRDALANQQETCDVPVNQGFLEVLKFGLPPIVGVGLGINRLAMTLLGELPKKARETSLYPL